MFVWMCPHVQMFPACLCKSDMVSSFHFLANCVLPDAMSAHYSDVQQRRPFAQHVPLFTYPRAFFARFGQHVGVGRSMFDFFVHPEFLELCFLNKYFRRAPFARPELTFNLCVRVCVCAGVFFGTVSWCTLSPAESQ